MLEPAQELPRVFQMNLYRFYMRVVAPTMNGLGEPQRWELGDLGPLDAGLDRAAAQVDAYTRNEAAKAYVLVLSAMFERQLRQWALHLFQQLRKPDVGRQNLVDLLDDSISKAGLDGASDGVRETLVEAHEIGNVVRHGDGSASKALTKSAPRFWSHDPRHYVDISPGPSPESALLVIPAGYIENYTRAGLRFWGRADRLEGAVEDPPF
ncbi:hypothetical protein E0H40_16720 [Rhizobium leguminosarum bv. viciae]|nr:hypothetical protein E0H40_16720 [Rhizobium leguminosarum bv. viciae]TCB46620.1 hypothetical protein E0J20_30290 [Rhizobium leguminosarum bv. viciae]